jgi:transcriptional regulator with XRE-family HTH domain
MQLFQEFERRRKELGMSRITLAKRSRVSLPTINRILLNQSPTVSFANVLAIAEALGLEMKACESIPSDELRQRQARTKARRLVGMVQGTSALEGQGLNNRELEAMVARTTEELLASRRKLWGE